MRFAFYILSGYCLLACTVVSGKITENVKPLEVAVTEAPLMRSTIKPTVAPPTVATPTKSPVIRNVPPKFNESSKEKPLEATKAAETEISNSKLHASEGKPVQVTGFITKNGNIYELENKDGIGLIEGRQTSPADEKMNVCNYGSVVVYSDVPCNEVTNVRVGDVQKTTVNAEKDQMQQSQAGENTNQLQNNDASVDDEARRRRPQQNRRRNGLNQQNRRRGGQNNKRRRQGITGTNPQNRPANVRRGQQQNPQRHRKQQQKNRRRRLQNQQNIKRHRKNQNNNGNNGNNNNKNQNRIQQKQNRRRIRQGNANRNGNRHRNGLRNGNGSKRRGSQQQQQRKEERFNEGY